MFTSEHEIWKAAYVNGELTDWLSYAEDRIAYWSSQNEVTFQTTWEIIVAAMLMVDNLLPKAARAALAKTTLETIAEADRQRYTLQALKVSPGAPGRKTDRREKGAILFKVRDLIKEGMTKTAAYERVANIHHKSPETIRRLYERALKAQRQNTKNPGR